jgi:multiple sugar transport system permease protein
MEKANALSAGMIFKQLNCYKISCSIKPAVVLGRRPRLYEPAGRIHRRRELRAHCVRFFQMFQQKLKDKHLWYFFVSPATLTLVLVLGFPAVITALYSITPERGRMLDAVTVDNYIRVMNDPLFWTSFLNTLLFVASSVAFHFILGLTLALFLNEALWGNLFFRIIMLIPWTIPDVVAGIIWKWMLNPVHGVVNDVLSKMNVIEEPILWLSSADLASPSLITCNIWRGFPFVMIILLAGLKAIPNELYEAAAIDGASILQRLRFITLPGLRKMIVVALALDTVWEFRRFGLVKAMTGGGPGHATEILSLSVYKQYFEFFRFEYASAVAIVMSLVLLVISFPYIMMIVRER